MNVSDVRDSILLDAAFLQGGVPAVIEQMATDSLAGIEDSMEEMNRAVDQARRDAT